MLSFFYLLLIILIGGFLRFYKLDWGNGLFTHPDEYHIVSSVSQLSFPTQMHPNFFSYGTLTIYLIYFTKQFLQILNSEFLTLNSFLIGRFYSALFSTLTIIFVYKICRTFLNRRFSYLAGLLTALTPGLIQQAHFATPESALTFFIFASLYFLIKFVKQTKISFLIAASIFFGFALGVKISSAVFFISFLIVLIFASLPRTQRPVRQNADQLLARKAKDQNAPTARSWVQGLHKKFLKIPFKFFLLSSASLIIIVSAFFAVAPFVFIDFPAFRGNLEYEGGLAAGKFSVFYTRQFIDTIPVLFQLEKILPYALGPTLLIFGIFGFSLLVLKSLSNRTIKQASNLTIITFLALFLSNAFLFAKWTRFIAPTFPFFAIFASCLLYNIYTKSKLLSNFLTIALLFFTSLWTIAFFSIYMRPDIRITASNWIEENLPKDSTILIEGGNMVDIPLKGGFNRIGFDFYVFEENPQTRLKIAEGLENADYFLVQSRRVFMNHQRLPDLFPKTANFYNALFNGKLGFEQINEFHSYPKLPLINIEFPDEKAEETWDVFDHPVIRVFQKTQQISQEEYAELFEN